MRNLFTISAILLLVSCSNNTENQDDMNTSNDLDCAELTTALLELNEETLGTLLDPELEKLKLLDQDNNSCLHDNNLKAFTELINDNCSSLTASTICCGCVLTFLAISEVSVTIDSSGNEVTRVLDLVTPSDEGMPLTFRGIHF